MTAAAAAPVCGPAVCPAHLCSGGSSQTPGGVGGGGWGESCTLATIGHTYIDTYTYIIMEATCAIMEATCAIMKEGYLCNMKEGHLCNNGGHLCDNEGRLLVQYEGRSLV